MKWNNDYINCCWKTSKLTIIQQLIYFQNNNHNIDVNSHDISFLSSIHHLFIHLILYYYINYNTLNISVIRYFNYNIPFLTIVSNKNQKINLLSKFNNITFWYCNNCRNLKLDKWICFWSFFILTISDI